MGAPDALFELGMLYATGRDVAADLVVAHKWFNLAASRGDPTEPVTAPLDPRGDSPVVRRETATAPLRPEVERPEAGGATP